MKGTTSSLSAFESMAGVLRENTDGLFTGLVSFCISVIPHVSFGIFSVGRLSCFYCFLHYSKTVRPTYGRRRFGAHKVEGLSGSVDGSFRAFIQLKTFSITCGQVDYLKSRWSYTAKVLVSLSDREQYPSLWSRSTFITVRMLIVLYSHTVTHFM